MSINWLRWGSLNLHRDRRNGISLKAAADGRFALVLWPWYRGNRMDFSGAARETVRVPDPTNNRNTTLATSRLHSARERAFPQSRVLLYHGFALPPLFTPSPPPFFTPLPVTLVSFRLEGGAGKSVHETQLASYPQRVRSFLWCISFSFFFFFFFFFFFLLVLNRGESRFVISG